MSRRTPAFVFGVDLDGVVADFYGGMRPVAAEWTGRPLADLPLDVSFGLDEWGIGRNRYPDLHRFAVVQRDLFRRLEPIPGAPQALRRLSESGVRIRIITHRLFLEHIHEKTITQTVAWLDHHGVPYWDLCFMKDKAAVGADLYIDDSPDNLKALVEDGQAVVAFTNSTNRTLDLPLRSGDWLQVETIVRERMAAFLAQGEAHRLAGH
ncbi:putative 5'(3')-deoxyribonucleotidase [Planctomycetota bacterium]|nr:putative 5'(3')-deoxyribonucleotidase [Planctomycetota bacterium]